MTKPIRHIMGLSGGKDSTALAVLLHKEIPEMEYFFCDTGKELQETYDYLDKVKARLGIKIKYLSPEKGFDHWLEVYDGYLPSPRSRWCTKQLKIIPLEKFIGDDEAVSYVGIRADENRDGYISTKPTLKPVYPFKERGMVKADIIRLLEDHGLGLPEYYQWRSRSGCFFCFFQRKYEWIMLHEKHPDLFAEAVRYEQEHKDGRKYTWTDGETLLELLGRKQEILESHEKSIKRETEKAPNKPLSEVLSEVLDEEDNSIPCLMCHL
jgi:3'-phosphoadenosine 5'-phosphosulfate sulfotransferase (PAPS reductase)/FAD synthetase